MKKTKKIIAVVVIIGMVLAYFGPFKAFADGPENGGGNESADVTVTGGYGGFNRTYYDPAQNKDVERYVSYKEYYINARIAINDCGFEIPDRAPATSTATATATSQESDEIPECATIEDVRYNYSANDYAGTENEGKVKITLGSLFTDKLVDTFTINGDVYNVSDFINYANREDWLNHYDGQMVSFDVYVDKADDYNIEVNVEPSDASSCFIGNFLWTGDPNQEYQKDPDGNDIVNPETGEKEKNDNYIGHSKLQLVKVEYKRNGEDVVRDFSNETTVDTLDQGEREIGPGRYYHNFGDGDLEYGYQTKENNQAVDYDDGSLVVPEGATVTMKIVPDYGYQVTSFGINGQNVITGDNISEFTFKIEKGNFHLGAEVTKVDNKVNSSVDSVKSGKVDLSENTLDSGTAVLSVNEADITDEKKAQFEASLPEGYEIDGFADISLAQVFYKGTEDDVWSVEKDELDGMATITLGLSEDIDPENTILLHNVHNGEEIKKVDFTYNKDTKELTFDENGFSNFAIAKKEGTTTDSSTSSTTDNSKETTTDSSKTTTTTNDSKENATETSNDATVEETKTENKKDGNPTTGDYIVRFVTAFAVAGLVFYVVRKNNTKVSKH